MLFTNTYTTYLIFPVYLIYTEFEHLIMYCCCRPRLTSLFPMKARQQADSPREDSQRETPPNKFFFLFFFFFFFFFFISLLGSWVGPYIFFFAGWGSGTTWLVRTANLGCYHCRFLLDGTSIQWNMLSVMWGDEFSLFLCKKNKNLRSRSSSGFQTLILAFTILWRTVLS